MIFHFEMQIDKQDKGTTKSCPIQNNKKNERYTMNKTKQNRKDVKNKRVKKQSKGSLFLWFLLLVAPLV